MKRVKGMTNHRAAAVLALALTALLAAQATATTASEQRASWLLERGQWQDLAATGHRFEQAEIGGGGGADEVEVRVARSGGRRSGALPVLASLVLPGAGEAMMGYKRGYFMMAADIFAWSQVIKYHGDGNDLRDAYYAFADEHYSDERLVEAFRLNSLDIERDGVGDHYFDFENLTNINSVADLHYLPLYVTIEDDRREYYENLGKWNQFVFGWDDFVNPLNNPGYTPTNDQLIDLAQPWVSQNRETYRIMRDESNQAFKDRDRWLYLNIGLRIVSVLQTAYLQGLLGGGPADNLEVSGHEIRFHAQPMGLTRGVMATSVTF